MSFEFTNLAYSCKDTRRMQHASKRRSAGGFCEWLVEVLDEIRCPKLAYWVDKSKRIFAVRWINARSKLWTKEDGKLFELWMTEGSRRSRGALTTPRVHKDMKTNFRMNLASDKFSELIAMRETKGLNAVRWYKINEESTKPKDLKSQGLPGIVKIERQPEIPPRKEIKDREAQILRKVSRTGIEAAMKNVTASVFPRNDSQPGRGITENYSRGTTESVVWPTADHTREANAGFATPRVCDVGSLPPVTTPHAPYTSEAYPRYYHGKVDFQLSTPQQPITTPRLSFQNTPIYNPCDDVMGQPADVIENSFSSGYCTTGDISPRLHHLGSIPECSNQHSITSDESYYNPSNYNHGFLNPRDLLSDGPTVLELLKDGNKCDEWRRNGSPDINSTPMSYNSTTSNSSVDTKLFARPVNTDLAWSDGGSENSSDLDDMWYYWHLRDLQRFNNS